ncbi:fumarate hydratase [Succinispira mobilis]|uniref:fumarate hydratase n=1 Tax=Succinispira mobilis TaxID=78120 RepID=UPI0003813502|nr:fumarate hydratase [Succinispira mobilis]
MREILASEITKAVEKLSIDASYYLTEDVLCGLKKAAVTEESPLGKEIIETIVENAVLAKENDVPICQDTGMAVIFVKLGQDVHVIGGDIYQAINAGVASGYTKGYLRKSVVNDPVFARINTKDNTPAVVHLQIVPGDKIDITLAPKGFGSENMGALKMCKPSEGVEGVIDFVVETVKKAGPNPCPPIVVGVGIGGTMEKATMLAKESLIRPLGKSNSDEKYAQLEKEILAKVNASGIGPQGLGGRNTALAVHIEYYPTHIAGMPVAVNINCHASRHAHVEI